MTLRDQLLELAEPAYRNFIMPLMPGVEHVIGIRLPLLRRLAREIVHGDWRAWLAEAESGRESEAGSGPERERPAGTGSKAGGGTENGNGPERERRAGTMAEDGTENGSGPEPGALYFEERMLRGMVIGYAPCPIAEKLEHTARFVPSIDNWAVCDSFCWRLEAGEREPAWRFLQPYFRSEQPYEVRFAVVMALGNFVYEEHIDDLLGLLGGIRHNHYYVRMGVAWAVSVCFVKFPERTRAWLTEACPLEDRTYNKSLQKIVESLRVDATTKEEVRALKRGAEKRRGRRTFAK